MVARTYSSQRQRQMVSRRMTGQVWLGRVIVSTAPCMTRLDRPLRRDRQDDFERVDLGMTRPPDQGVESGKTPSRDGFPRPVARLGVSIPGSGPFEGRSWFLAVVRR